MFCANCRNKLIESANYCGMCGRKVIAHEKIELDEANNKSSYQELNIDEQVNCVINEKELGNYVVDNFSCDEKVQAIEYVRNQTGWGLRETKDFVDGLKLTKQIKKSLYDNKKYLSGHMNIDMATTKIIPFSFSEDDANKEFVQFLVSGHMAPVDVAYYSKIKSLKRLYMPVRNFELKYTCDWEATSIWKEKQARTITETQTVYVSRLTGEESKKMKYDYHGLGSSVRSSSTRVDGAIPFMPQQKIVSKTVYDLVEVHRENTYGDIGEQHLSIPVITCERFNSDFLNWVLETPISVAKPYSSGYMNDSEIVELMDDYDRALELAEDEAEKKALHMCKTQIPGTEYCDFWYNFYTREVSAQVIWYPVFQIEYEYKGKSYVLYLNGIDYKNKYAESYPVDNNIQVKQQNMQRVMDKAKRNKTKFGCLGFFLYPLELIISLFVCFAASVTGEMDGFALLILMLGIAGEIFSLHMRNKAKKEINQMSININTYSRRINEIRKEIAFITMDNSIEEDAKNKKIQQMIRKIN